MIRKRKGLAKKMAGYQLAEGTSATTCVDYICPVAVCTYSNSTAGCAPCQPCYPKGYGPKQEEKESVMYDNNSLETSQRNHLRRRIDDTFYGLKEKLREQFNMNGVPQPTTADEITKKLTAGEFVLNKDYFDKNGNLQQYCSALSTIEWIDPAHPKDEAGYKLARAALDKACQSAKDTALIAPLADGLKALTDFEAWTYTAPASA